MVFIFSAWDKFCSDLKQNGISSIPAKEVTAEQTHFLVLKHDIENTVQKAYELAKIEHKYGHRGSYYVHAYLLDDSKSLELLRKIQAMGHEVSYHYDVMDSNHGDLDGAIKEFEFNREKFETLGFPIVTVCQHGNPVVERIGYSSNRDFFRSHRVQLLYPEIADIMVDYKEKYHANYTYFSDAGRKFKLIYDPVNNDIMNSDDKNVPYEDLDELLNSLPPKAIVSTHPHRWAASAASYIIEEKLFNLIKGLAKMAMRIPGAKKVMSRYYYLAKKI